MTQVQILHTADAHLGGSGPAFGDRVREHQQRIEDAFARCIDIALVHNVAAVCLVGDLFDGPRPSERVFQFALTQLGRLQKASPAIPCFILPGNHDLLGPGGIYSRPEWDGSGLHVWREAGTRQLPDGSIAFHANPQRSDTRAHHPMQGIAPDPSARFNVTLAHGYMLVPDITDNQDVLITSEEIAASGMDYVALGHYHDPGDQSAGGVVARFCGSPEIITIGQRQIGGALLVTLSEQGVSLERRQTGTLMYDTLELDPEVYPGEPEIAEAIRARTDGNLMLDVTVSGLAPEGFTCDASRLQEEFESSFFRLRISDGSVIMPAASSLDAPKEHFIASRAIELYRERIEQARSSGDERSERIARRALQLSMALFEGKEVLQ